MATEESGERAGHDPIEALVDDLIRDILGEASPAAKGRTRGKDTVATLIDKALTAPREAPATSHIEKLLLAQVLASALADALAPALAEALAPEIMKSLEQRPDGNQGRGRPTAAAGAARATRKKT